MKKLLIVHAQDDLDGLILAKKLAHEASIQGVVADIAHGGEVARLDEYERVVGLGVPQASLGG